MSKKKKIGLLGKLADPTHQTPEAGKEKLFKLIKKNWQKRSNSPNEE